MERYAIVREGGKCPKCGSTLKAAQYRHRRSVALNCPRCGRGFAPDGVDWKNANEFVHAQKHGFKSSY